MESKRSWGAKSIRGEEVFTRCMSIACNRTCVLSNIAPKTATSLQSSRYMKDSLMSHHCPSFLVDFGPLNSTFATLISPVSRDPNLTRAFTLPRRPFLARYGSTPKSTGPHDHRRGGQGHRCQRDAWLLSCSHPPLPCTHRNQSDTSTVPAAHVERDGSLCDGLLGRRDRELDGVDRVRWVCGSGCV